MLSEQKPSFSRKVDTNLGRTLVFVISMVIGIMIFAGIASISVIAAILIYLVGFSLIWPVAYPRDIKEKNARTSALLGFWISMPLSFVLFFLIALAE